MSALRLFSACCCLVVAPPLLACASRDPAPPAADPAKPAADPAERGGAPADASSVTPEPWRCPAGPFDAPLSGERTAAPLPGTQPTDLDPTDTEFHLYEGPVWKDGALYFSDFKTSAGFPSRVMRHAPGQALQIAIANSGSNGLALTPSGNLAAARHGSKSIAVFTSDGTATTDLAQAYAGKGFNSPNDLTFRGDGNLYFTDPDFQAAGDEPQPTTNVYRVAPDGTVGIVDPGIANPNGIALSPDGNTLYVAGNLEHGFLKRYPVAPDGTVGPGEILVSGITVPDGMAIDCAGNVYVTEHTERRIRVLAPDGRELGRIVGMDKNVTNAAFGGDERKTLFITGTGRLFAIELGVPGYPY